MALPENAKAIYEFLVSHGYSSNGAAGIVGNIEQESGGNPAAPTGGLIQILRGGPGYTSNTSLAAQMNSILAYNNAQGSALIQQLNQQSSPSAAALFYSERFERPLASAANNPNREQSANDVAAAAKSGNWKAGSPSVVDSANAVGGPTYSDLGVPSVLSGASGLLKDVATVLDYTFGMFGRGQGWRFAFTAIAAAALYGSYKILAGPGAPGLPKVVPIPI